MNRPFPLLCVLFVTAALLLASVPGQANENVRNSNLRVWAGAGVHTYSSGSGPTGQLTLRYSPFEHLVVDVTGRSGAVLNHFDGRDTYFGTLLLGAGLSSGMSRQGWQVRLVPRLMHVHHATGASWLDTPGANVAGDSSGGVLHRSGAELGLGVTSPPFGSLGQYSLIWDAEINAGVLPASLEMRRSLGVLFGVSLTKRPAVRSSQGLTGS